MLACVVLVAIPASWRIRSFEDFAYRQHVEEYTEVRPGGVVRIPINPPGWFMELRKPVDADKPSD
jgi:hypothetical protein